MPGGYGLVISQGQRSRYAWAIYLLWPTAIAPFARPLESRPRRRFTYGNVIWFLQFRPAPSSLRPPLDGGDSVFYILILGQDTLLKILHIGALPRRCRPQVTRIGTNGALHSRSAIPRRFNRGFASSRQFRLPSTELAKALEFVNVKLLGYDFAMY